jgi:hypothetical protein
VYVDLLSYIDFHLSNTVDEFLLIISLQMLLKDLHLPKDVTLYLLTPAINTLPTINKPLQPNNGEE